ncbi:MAG: Undecaprenyl-phosphate 4-deoxy-4-formamido-L-arabinose transferase [Candidatus Accumulibacter phosphatis]|jgi:glycosyltransferase involved in cell wall biosynthesis|uniref:Undecaprenyl-phosphate 4-deoxy-4-formamido-L-arabinose transferase n=1 Tax=Candidatus Accumulibacter phosphatis TaxID=327160 RepID=A0A080LRS5_9PROT|nr:MAG: Undecaprenyl-phosphate 4-deoxy-4-formamido-L-arabinose transferase [Candidatus Accumulibacter phosphatis]MBL8408091.1 glycosyltransferase family 2 protein [Accumulibacter sp.]
MSSAPSIPSPICIDKLPAELSSLDLSVVVPVYNSAGTLPALLERLTLVLEGITPRYEIILVDDGSRDDSWGVIQSLTEIYGERLLGVQLMRNYGQHNTLMCGLGLARGAYVVTMDDDLQNPPEEIANMLDYIRLEGLDLVYGCPDHRSHAKWRNLGASVVWRFYRTVFRNPVTPTPFRIMRHQLARSVLFYDLNFTYLDGLLAWCTSRIGGVTVKHHARPRGRSGYSLTKLIGLALNLYTNFSLIPLQTVSVLGFATASAGFLVGLYYLVQFLASNIAIPGYASTIIAILLLGGAQLLALGVIGEYLGRLHLNVNRKPQYVIRQVTSSTSFASSGPDHA